MEELDEKEIEETDLPPVSLIAIVAVDVSAFDARGGCDNDDIAVDVALDITDSAFDVLELENAKEDDEAVRSAALDVIVRADDLLSERVDDTDIVGVKVTVEVAVIMCVDERLNVAE